MHTHTHTHTHIFLLLHPRACGPTKICIVKAIVFPVVMFGCESWTIQKAEYQRLDAFELWCWRRLLRVPWTARRANQSILKEISPEYSLEGLMLKLKLQYFGHLMQRADSFEKTWCWERLGAGGEGDDRGWDGWMASPTQWTWVWASYERWWRTGKSAVLQSRGSQRVRYDWATEQQQQELVGSNSPTRYQTHAPSLEAHSLSHWTTMEVPKLIFLKHHWLRWI